MSASVSNASINIVLDYGATSAADVVTYGAAFNAAETFWESNLSGYRDGLLAPTSVIMNVALGNIDGAGGTLGSAGPTQVNIQGDFFRDHAGQHDL